MVAANRTAVPIRVKLRTALARFFGLSERTPRCLTQAEANQQYHEGMVFIDKSLELAQISVRFGFFRHVRFISSVRYDLFFIIP